MIDHRQPVRSRGRAFARDWPETFALYLVDRLPPEEAAEVRAYVHADRETSRRVAGVRRSIDTLVRDLRPLRPRASVRQRLLDQLESQPVAAGGGRRGLALPARLDRAPSIAAAIGLCAVAALAATLLTDGGPARSPRARGEDAPALGAPGTAPEDPMVDIAAAPRVLDMIVRGAFTPAAPADGDPAPARGERTGAQLAAHDRGHFLYDARTHMFYVFLPLLPPAGDGNSYHLLLTSKAENSPFYAAGEVSVDERGHGWLEVDVDMAEFASARIYRGPQGAPERAVDEVFIGHFER